MDFRLDPDDELYRQELRRFATYVPNPHYQAEDARLRPTLAAEMAGRG